MAVVRKKQDDKNLKLLRELVTTGAGNRQCFDCGQKGPTYVNMTIGTFCCTRCSGVLRGLTPPHRVKSISMATFSPDEIEFLKSHGNEECAKTWLGLWDPKRNVHQDQRELIIDKYERKRYYLEPGSPLKSITNLNSNSNNHSSSNGNSNIINTNPTNILTKTNSSSNNSSFNHLSNGLKSITLTPPSSRGSHSSLNGSLNGSTGGGSISTKQSDSFNNTSAVNGFNNFLNRKTSNSSVDCGSSINGNCNGSSGFSSDSDFADFGSANIFDATITGGNTSVSSNNSSFNNSFKQQNGFDVALQNGRSPASAVNNENFADFDHAPIYNAAGLPATNPHINGNSNTNTSMKTSSAATAPSMDRYAALKDLDEEFRETKAQAAAQAAVQKQHVVAASSTVTNGNNVMGSPNPFKAQQPVANPFQASGNVQMFQSNGPVAPQPMFGSGFNSNGFTNGNNFGGSPYVPNGSCGFGFGALQPQQPIAATGMGTFSNPFAATVNSGNSNNPFL